MAGKLPLMTIADCASPEPYSTQIGPFGEKLRAHSYVPAGVPVLRGTNVNPDGRFHDDDFVFIDPEWATTEFDKFVCEAGDVILCHKGTLGKIGIIPKNSRFPKYVMGNSMLKVRCDRAKLEPLYLYYWLCSADGQNYLFSRVSQVGVPQIQRPLSTLREALLPIPPLPEQRAIIHILGSLDDKIELNRRMNETLEAMARALFKSWFVDFDPIHAKAEGRQPSGLDPATAALFPSELQDSELGEIPKDWRVGTIGDLIDIHDSKRIPLSSREREQRHGPYPYYGATSIMDHVDDYLFDGIYVLVGEDGSVVTDDGHPFMQYVWGKFWVNNHAHVLTGRHGVSQEQLYLLLGRTNIAAFVTGAVQAKLSQGNLKKIPTVVAPDIINRAFSEQTSDLFGRFRANIEECATLARLRDALLPRLLSGELSVGKAMKLVEATA